MLNIYLILGIILGLVFHYAVRKFVFRKYLNSKFTMTMVFIDYIVSIMLIGCIIYTLYKIIR